MFTMPEWLYISLITVESLCCLYLLYVAIAICVQHPEFVFKKVPMTSLYGFAVTGITVNLVFIWLDIQAINTNTQLDTAVHALYLSQQFCQIALQHCLLMNLTEFYLQIRVLTEGKFLNSSIHSDFNNTFKAEA